MNRKNPDIHTNTIEGYFSIFKRGMKGVYQHCAKRHLHRYATEFEFRYSHRVANGFTDEMRAQVILRNPTTITEVPEGPLHSSAHDTSRSSRAPPVPAYTADATQGCVVPLYNPSTARGFRESLDSR